MIQSSSPLPARSFCDVGLPGIVITPGTHDTWRSENGAPLYSLGTTQIMAIHTLRKPPR